MQHSFSRLSTPCSFRLSYVRPPPCRHPCFHSSPSPSAQSWRNRGSRVSSAKPTGISVGGASQLSTGLWSKICYRKPAFMAQLGQKTKPNRNRTEQNTTQQPEAPAGRLRRKEGVQGDSELGSVTCGLPAFFEVGLFCGKPLTATYFTRNTSVLKNAL